MRRLRHPLPPPPLPKLTLSICSQNCSNSFGWKRPKGKRYVIYIHVSGKIFYEIKPLLRPVHMDDQTDARSYVVRTYNGSSSHTYRHRVTTKTGRITFIVTSSPMQVSDIVHHAPLGKSDHSVISFIFHSYLDYTKPKERYSYEKADFQAMRNHIAETKWYEEYLILVCGRNKDELWNHLKL